jgi:predicted acylesterase/phospholipase RssA
MQKALILPGGGAWGAVQAGALETIHQAGILNGVDLMLANSVGNLNQGIYVKGLYDGIGPANLRKLWLGIKGATDIISPDFTPIALHPWEHPLEISGLCNGAVFGRGAFSTDALLALVHNTMGELTTDQIMQKLGIKVRSIAYSNKQGMGRMLAGLMWKLMMASCAIEVAFPARFGLSDGGPVANNPVRWAIKAGVKQIVVVYTGGPVAEMPEDDLVLDATTVDEPILARDVAASFLANVTQVNESQAEQDIVDARAQGIEVLEVYTKSDVEGSILNFDPDVLATRWKQGQVAGQEAIAEATSMGWIKAA